MRLILALSLVSGVAMAKPVPVSSAAELSAALLGAVTNDEIILAAGTYKLSGASCSATGPVLVRAITPLSAVIEFDGLEGFQVTGPGWRFQGLDVRGVCAADDDCEHAFHVMGGATGFVLRGSSVRDFNAQLKVNAVAGVMPHDGLVEGNEFYDTHVRNTGKPVTKINIDTGDRWIVRANLIHDFHKFNGEATYGAFMKSGGKQGLFERNLVICERDVVGNGSAQLGLSFGGGGTAAQFCAPAFSAAVPCDVEHDGGTMRNNIIVNCSDVGIYLNRARDTRLFHNTLVATTGIDFRYPTSSGEARGNAVSGAIRLRDDATYTKSDNLENLTTGTFTQLYVAPLTGDLRLKGDPALLVGQAPVEPAVKDDYCLRVRGMTYDIGALQHALGDCDTRVPPLASGTPGGGGGQPFGDGGISGGGGGGFGQPPREGCGCHVGAAPAPIAGMAALILLAIVWRRRRIRF